MVGFEPMTYRSDSECATNYTIAHHKLQLLCSCVTLNTNPGSYSNSVLRTRLWNTHLQ